MCNTKAGVEETRRRMGSFSRASGSSYKWRRPGRWISRKVDERFDFLGCQLRKRLSGPIWERSRQRVYFLQRWSSQRAMKRVRARVRELTPRGRCHQDLREMIASLNPVVRGWGQYFRTGKASRQFLQLHRYVVDRLRGRFACTV